MALANLFALVWKPFQLFRQHEDQESPYSKTNKTSRLRLLLPKLAKWTLLILLALTAFWLVARYLAVPMLVYLFPSLDTTFYDLAIYGRYPERRYVSFSLASPRSSVVKWDDSCDTGLVMLDLHGGYVSSEGPMILDMRGELVWITDSYGLATNLKVQRYRGEDFLTFWAGKKSTTAFGRGKYYMLNSSYNLVHQVEAVGDAGDLHEFLITDNNTALITVYAENPLDLSDTPMSWVRDGVIVDGLIQEIDIATGDLLFEWRASDHMADVGNISHGGYVQGITTGLDYFHLNSVQKDSKGNYLVSARFVHKIFLIDAQTGDLTWSFGGDSTDFRDISGGAASDFMWQHDVRWVDEAQGIISLFDNGVAYGEHWDDSAFSTGRIIKLDFAARTAELLHSYRSLRSIRAKSQGSVQVLPPSWDSDSNENSEEEAVGELTRVFIGWGSSAAFTEYTLNGTVLCETHYSASLFYKQEPAKSYRAIKTPAWRGRPSWPPAAVIQGSGLYVSWNGATDIAAWTLQGRREGAGNGDVEDIETVKKTGFETRISLPRVRGAYAAFRVAAVGEDGEVIRVSEVASVISTSWYKLTWLWIVGIFGPALLLGWYRRELRRVATGVVSGSGEIMEDTKYHRLEGEDEEIALYQAR